MVDREERHQIPENDARSPEKVGEEVCLLTDHKPLIELDPIASSEHSVSLSCRLPYSLNLKIRLT